MLKFQYFSDEDGGNIFNIFKIIFIFYIYIERMKTWCLWPIKRRKKKVLTKWQSAILFLISFLLLFLENWNFYSNKKWEMENEMQAKYKGSILLISYLCMRNWGKSVLSMDVLIQERDRSTHRWKKLQGVRVRESERMGVMGLI